MRAGRRLVVCFMVLSTIAVQAGEMERFNRSPLRRKPYAELPLGSIEPQGWLKSQLQTMAGGLSGHLDELYSEVCGERNAWLGGDGDAWERGPYWIDGLYPLAKLLDDPALEAKALRWIEWTLANQRPNGQIGPRDVSDVARTEAPPKGAQVENSDDWWPRMVMLKILQQYYMASGDERVVDCMTRYFRYQLSEIDRRPLYEPDNPEGGSWWAKQRGGDNVMSVYWLYNVTGDAFLLELADKLKAQSYPWVEDFRAGEKIQLFRFTEHHDGGDAYHCVNLAHALKYPAIYYQRSGNSELLCILDKAWEDIQRYHGQPHGLWGGDEGMHGTDPTRGSEFCTISEAMFSFEKIFEITGDARVGDRLERVAFTPLPAQADDAFMSRQYFQQANQVSCAVGPHKFTNYPYEANVFGLISGYPCCTCNMHQAWPKFASHLWMGSVDGGLAAVSYAPSRVTAPVKDGTEVSIIQTTDYPFRETVFLSIEPEQPVEFPLHLRIPGWCTQASVKINGEPIGVIPTAGTMCVVERLWQAGDQVELTLPMKVRFERGHENSVTVLRGPLVYVLRMEEQWSRKEGVNEVRSPSVWNYSLFEHDLNVPNSAAKFRVTESPEPLAANPWTVDAAPVSIQAYGVRNPLWGEYHEEAGPLPWSPGPFPQGQHPEPIRLIPYGCSTLRISAFPTVL